MYANKLWEGLVATDHTPQYVRFAASALSSTSRWQDQCVCGALPPAHPCSEVLAQGCAAVCWVGQSPVRAAVPRPASLSLGAEQRVVRVSQTVGGPGAPRTAHPPVPPAGLCTVGCARSRPHAPKPPDPRVSSRSRPPIRVQDGHGGVHEENDSSTDFFLLLISAST